MLGGVPHDRYGMTSLSVRQYVLGIYKQLGLREKDITKVQTGGPGTFAIGCLQCLYAHFEQMVTLVQVMLFSFLQMVMRPDGLL